MTETEAAEWFKLLQAGGNAGIIVLAMIAIKVANKFLDRMDRLIEENQQTREQLKAGQEQIKLAIVAGNPKLEERFRQG